MSVAHVFYAERRMAGHWQLLGPLGPERGPGAPRRPTEVVEVGEHDELMTVLSGYLPYVATFHHSGLSVIAEPRGFPDDLSPELAAWVAEAIERDVVGRPSWLLVGEIVDFDWQRRNLLLSAYADPSKEGLFDPSDPSAPFPEDRWPGGREHVCSNPEQLERRLARGARPSEMLYLWRPPGAVEVFWSESHAEYLGWHAEFLASLRELGPPGEIRLVFWTEC